MDRIAIPMQRVPEKREPRPRRPHFDGERATERCSLGRNGAGRFSVSSGFSVRLRLLGVA